MSFEGSSLDDTLATIVTDRGMPRLLLLPQPRMSKVHNKPNLPKEPKVPAPPAARQRPQRRNLVKEPSAKKVKNAFCNGFQEAK